VLLAQMAQMALQVHQVMTERPALLEHQVLLAKMVLQVLQVQQAMLVLLV
jgi:hypothetical protein